MKKISEFFGNAGKKKLIFVPGLPVLFLLFLVLVALFAPLLAPHNPVAPNLSAKFTPPSWMEGGKPEYLLGTDYFGRDILSRLIYGTRISLLVVMLSIIISALIGTMLGLISGYIGGIVDAVIMRFVDAMLSIPYLVIAIALAVAVGASITSVILVIVVFQWPIYARQVRAETLSIKEQDFVALAKIAGASNLRIVMKHILSNVIPTILVLATLHIGELILWEATLSFLGVGVPQPTPTWGTMVSEGKDFITSRWWLCVIPGLAIVSTVFAANVVGDWVRDRLDPRLRQM